MPEFDSFSQQQVVEYLCPAFMEQPHDMQAVFTDTQADPFLVNCAESYLQRSVINGRILGPGLQPGSTGRAIIDSVVNNHAQLDLNPTADPTMTTDGRLTELFNSARTAGQGEANVQQVAGGLRMYAQNRPWLDTRNILENWVETAANAGRITNIDRTFTGWKWATLRRLEDGTSTFR